MPRHSGDYCRDDPEWQRIMNAEKEAQLTAYVVRQNKLRWVQASGKLFFVGCREKPDGTVEHYVDRPA